MIHLRKHASLFVVLVALYFNDLWSYVGLWNTFFFGDSLAKISSILKLCYQTKGAVSFSRWKQEFESPSTSAEIVNEIDGTWSFVDIKAFFLIIIDKCKITIFFDVYSH